jgi:hypothetical protein
LQSLLPPSGQPATLQLASYYIRTSLKGKLEFLLHTDQTTLITIYHYHLLLQHLYYIPFHYAASPLYAIPPAALRLASYYRVFLGARCTVFWDNAQIEAETLEKIECLKH